MNQKDCYFVQLKKYRALKKRGAFWVKTRRVLCENSTRIF